MNIVIIANGGDGNGRINKMRFGSGGFAQGETPLVTGSGTENAYFLHVPTLISLRFFFTVALPIPLTAVRSSAFLKQCFLR